MDRVTDSARILLVDDDPKVLSSLTRGLRLSGFRLETAGDGASALRAVSSSSSPDAIVLDINMPGLDGVSVVTALRTMGNEVPICVLSARSTVGDRIAGLEAGADDYLTKPFELGELVARLRALLRRAPRTRTPVPSGVVAVGELEVDLPGRRVLARGERIELTRREFDLLGVLAENPGIVLSRVELLQLVWGYDFDADTNVVDVFVRYVRKKLEANGMPRVLHTVRGVGFVLRDQP